MAKDSQYGGVPQGQEGLILQRGGEELQLAKVLDRFSFQSLLPPTQPWQDNLGLGQVRPVITPQSPGRGSRVDSAFPPASLWEVTTTTAQLESLLGTVRHQAMVNFASHLYHIVGDPQTLVYLRDEITLQFGPTVAIDRRIEIAANWGLVEKASLRGMAQAFRYQVTAAAPVNPIKLANILIALPEVLLAEPNVVIRQQTHYRPQDDRYDQQWYLHNTGGSEISPQAHIAVETAWDLTRGDRSSSPSPMIPWTSTIPTSKVWAKSLRIGTCEAKTFCRYRREKTITMAPPWRGWPWRRKTAGAWWEWLRAVPSCQFGPRGF